MLWRWVCSPMSSYIQLHAVTTEMNGSLCDWRLCREQKLLILSCNPGTGQHATRWSEMGRRRQRHNPQSGAWPTGFSSYGLRKRHIQKVLSWWTPADRFHHPVCVPPAPADHLRARCHSVDFDVTSCVLSNPSGHLLSGAQVTVGFSRQLLLYPQDSLIHTAG